MTKNYFQGCDSLESVKKRYKALAVTPHPDKGGSTQAIPPDEAR